MSAPVTEAPTCPVQEHTWWSQKCTECSHNLMLHNEIEGSDRIDCAICALDFKLASDTALRDFQRRADLTKIRKVLIAVADKLGIPRGGLS